MKTIIKKPKSSEGLQMVKMAALQLPYPYYSCL